MRVVHAAADVVVVVGEVDDDQVVKLNETDEWVIRNASSTWRKEGCPTSAVGGQYVPA